MRPDGATARAQAGGFSLVELMVATAITSLIAVAIGSAMMIAAHAVPDDQSGATVSLEAGRVLERLSLELQYALTVPERTDHAITFTVADRDDDGAAERLRYAWSGAAGAPLTRQVNDGPAVPVFDTVKAFDLAYTTRTLGETFSGTLVEQPEARLEYHDPDNSLLQGILIWLLGGGPRDYAVDASHWLGQRFSPNVGLTATMWRPTRVAVLARAEGTAQGKTRIQLRPLDADRLPTATVLGEQVLDEATLGSSWKWRSFDYDLPLRPVGQDVGLVLQWQSDAHSGEFAYESDPSGALWTSDGGDSWSYGTGSTMLFYLYGRTAAPGPAHTVQRRYLTRVDVTLAADADRRAAPTAVNLLNRPELLTKQWTLDFRRDPTQVDGEGDGQGDWAVSGGGSFIAADLSGGVWQPSQTIYTRPDNGFTELTTVRARMRHTVADGGGATLLINADWAGGSTAPLLALAQRQADGTQAMIVYAKFVDTWRPLVHADGLSDGFIDLRLLISPARDAVNVQINGADRGTFAYGFVTPTSESPVVMLSHTGSAAQIDYVSVRVGGIE